MLAENQAGAAPWYQLAYERLMQETPFTFAARGGADDAARRCRRAAGRTAGRPARRCSCVNHWINTDPLPRPSNAAIVNAYAPLLRAGPRRASGSAGGGSNLLAVDFYKRGDLFGVVDTLNGL